MYSNGHCGSQSTTSVLQWTLRGPTFIPYFHEKRLKKKKRAFQFWELNLEYETNFDHQDWDMSIHLMIYELPFRGKHYHNSCLGGSRYFVCVQSTILKGNRSNQNSYLGGLWYFENPYAYSWNIILYMNKCIYAYRCYGPIEYFRELVIYVQNDKKFIVRRIYNWTQLGNIESLSQARSLPMDFYSWPTYIPPKNLPTSNSPKHQSCDWQIQIPFFYLSASSKYNYAIFPKEYKHQYDYI